MCTPGTRQVGMETSSTMRHDPSRFALVLPLSIAAALLSGSRSAAADEITDTPRGSYVVVDPPPLRIETPTQAGGSPHVLFLNRCAGGQTVSPGNENSSANTSSILGGSVNFPEFPYGDAAWNEVVARTRELYTPFNVQVTDVDPAPAPHDEVIVCGDGAAAASMRCPPALAGRGAMARSRRAPAPPTIAVRGR